MANSSTQLPELQELSEQIGEFIHYWGFKRVHGRIWTQLFLSDKPLDSADLVRQMKISKALVSISVRELLEYEVITEAGKSDRGTNLYSVNHDVLQVILNVLRGREKRLLGRIQGAQEALERVPLETKIANDISPDRLEKLKTLVGDASSALEGLIALRNVNFSEFKDAFAVDQILCQSNSSSAGVSSSTPEREISSARAEGEIQLIGRPLLQKS